MLAVKRSAGVVPEVNLGECTLHSPPQKAGPPLALKLRGDITRNPKQGYQWPRNRKCDVNELQANYTENKEDSLGEGVRL